MADYGLKISKSGFDVKSTGDSNLTFNSELATHPIESISSVTVSSTPYTIAHGLSFVPKVWIFEDTGSVLKRIPDENSNGAIDYYIDGTNIVIESDSSRRNFNAKVIVFARSIT